MFSDIFFTLFHDFLLSVTEKRASLCSLKGGGGGGDFLVFFVKCLFSASHTVVFFCVEGVVGGFFLKLVGEKNRGERER